jgi:hypothetical protein
MDLLSVCLYLSSLADQTNRKMKTMLSPSWPWHGNYNGRYCENDGRGVCQGLGMIIKRFLRSSLERDKRRPSTLLSRSAPLSGPGLIKNHFIQASYSEGPISKQDKGDIGLGVA